jgi:hypothetical protein
VTCVAPRPTGTIALGALGLVALTAAHAIGQRDLEPERPSPAAYSSQVAATGSGRCALYHARFGGRRAELIQVRKGSVRNYVVIEVGKRDPALRSLRSTWLRTAYGEAEHVWLGEWGSAAAAMLRAARLCPAAQRCWPPDTDCGPSADVATTPAQIFFRHWPPATASGI